MRKRKIVKAFSALVCFSILTMTFSTYVYADEQADEQEDEISKELLPTSFWYNLVKVKEAVQLNVLTFKETSKATVLEDFTDQRVDEMSYAESVEDYEALDLVVERYESQKTDALEYAESAADDPVMNQIKENTLEQQQTMTQMQLRLEEGQEVQKNIVEVQNNVAEWVVDTVEAVQGEESSAEFDEQLIVVWMDPNADDLGNLPPLPDTVDAGNWVYAPGTEGRGEGGVVIEYSVAVDEADDEVDGNVIIEENLGGGTGGGEDGNVVIDEGTGGTGQDSDQGAGNVVDD
ncbi:MAG: DUF5667 domain-containing protein [Patescibacteria group bacterium]|nr:DUF5667 domain-containing protein [Patescibacteria group bacterium]